MKSRFRGSMVALVTPFLSDGSVDFETLARLVAHQIDGKTDGLIICGTTGEAVTMTPEEQAQTWAFVVAEVKGRIPVLAGTGSNNTKLAIEASLQAKAKGVDGLLVVTPPYNKPTQDGLLDYYRQIVKAAQMPIILYNVPGRTCSNLLPVTVAKLADDPWIVGIKDATGDLNVGSEIIERCGDKLTLLSGDDFTALPLLSIGGQGWISVTANVVPRLMSDLFRAWEAGDIAKARSLHYQTLPLHRAMFTQSNPIPVKASLSLMGFGANVLRSPLLPMSGEPLQTLRSLLASHNLL